MPRADFEGPVRARDGFEVGEGDNVISVIDSDGIIHTTINIGSTAAPVEVIGDVTGDLTGNVTGDVTGDVTGNVTGNVTGDLTGNVTGNVTGNLTGDVDGDVGSSTSPATVYGYMGGTFIGSVAMLVSGTSTELSAPPASSFQIVYTSTGGLLLTTSTGIVGTITVAT